jgi:hypothetical protein
VRGIRSNRIRSKRAAVGFIAAIAAAFLFIGGPAAMAQEVSPTGDQYERGIVATASGGGPAEPGAAVQSTESAETLPFTGLDVGAIVVIGIALVGAGLVIRRVSRAGSAEV